LHELVDVKVLEVVEVEVQLQLQGSNVGPSSISKSRTRWNFISWAVHPRDIPEACSMHADDEGAMRFR
jgi:hypothetical protein